MMAAATHNKQTTYHYYYYYSTLLLHTHTRAGPSATGKAPTVESERQNSTAREIGQDKTMCCCVATTSSEMLKRSIPDTCTILVRYLALFSRRHCNTALANWAVEQL